MRIKRARRLPKCPMLLVIQRETVREVLPLGDRALRDANGAVHEICSCVSGVSRLYLKWAR